MQHDIIINIRGGFTNWTNLWSMSKVNVKGGHYPGGVLFGGKC